MIGLVGLIIIFGAGALAPLVAPYTFDQIDLNNVLHPPTMAAHHFFGTDEIGRDYLSRTIYGIRTSEQVGVVVALVASLFGLFVVRSRGSTVAGSTTPSCASPTSC